MGTLTPFSLNRRWMRASTPRHGTNLSPPWNVRSVSSSACTSSPSAAYHGAEHVSIGTYEHGEPAAKEHERCGTHLVGPLLLATAAGATLAGKAPRSVKRPANLAAAIGAMAAATEIFGWMVRNPEHPVAKALARPGQELQERVATAEPSPEQIEVADAALQACLELEQGR